MSPQKSPPPQPELDLSPAPPPRRPGLSKSRFVAGKQCHRLLWWKVFDANAVELQPDIVLQDLFDQGVEVGRRAREQFPGGTLIDLPHDAYADKVAATAKAMATDTPAIYEASFVADDVFVAVDVLLREPDGRWRLIEVKQTKEAKEKHLADAAIQLYVLEQCGLRVSGVDIMHLNDACRFPELGDLLVRTEVTDDVRALQAEIPAEIAAQLAMLAGPLPDVAIGLHCHDPFPCAFHDRCWPRDADHISRLYNVGPKKSDAYMRNGIHRIGDIPEQQKKKLPPAAKRQLRAMETGDVVVEDGLADALAPYNCRLGFLDFETIARAIPVWPGMGPWDQEPAQFSYHEFDYTKSSLTPEDETKGHFEFLAEGPSDCRPALARAMVEATRSAEHVVAFTGFEKRHIRGLQQTVPELAAELEELERKLLDLHPVLREYVYHPGFLGSFSLKSALPALVPELSYGDLVIVDGMVASVQIARLLFVTGHVPEPDQARVREDLLRYCKRDTWAMVKLLERLRALARG